MSSKSRIQLEDWISTINVPDGAKVLDVGGSQLPAKGRVGYVGKDSEFKILDLKQPHEVKQQPDIVWDLNDVVSTEEIAKHYGKYDVAFCFEVMEYTWNPVMALDNINEFLKVDGVLYISFHFLYPYHNPVEEDCLRYTYKGAMRLLEQAGFEIDTLIERKLEPYAMISWNELIKAERMRPSAYADHTIAGALIKAIKKG